MSELPEGWTRARLPKVAALIMGQSPPSSSYNASEVGLPFFQGKAEFGEIYPTPVKYCSAPQKIAEKADILISVRAPVGPTNICKEKSCIGRGLAAIRPRTGVSGHYVFYFLRSIEQWLANQGTGSTFTAISKSDLERIEVPLPPLNEQRRISAKLEESLGKVNACRKRLTRIPGILKRFRQAALAAGCSGRLSADWRTEENVAEHLEHTTVEAIAEYAGGFAYKSGTFIETGHHQVIRIGNVRPLALNLTTSPVFIPENIVAETQRFRLQPNDLVISMTGTKYKRDYGNAAMVKENDGSLYLNQRVARLRCRETVLPKFLLYWLQTDFFRDFFFAGETGNVNQGNVGADGIRKAPIDLASLEEQHEIVRRVEALFALADQIEARYIKAQTYVDRLTQSILAKAFRGELVPTEAALARLEGRDYEPASALLDRTIIKDSAQTPGFTEKQRRPRRPKRA